MAMAAAKPLVLIIEDDPTSSEALALILRDWGAEVIVAQDEPSARAGIGARMDQLRYIITDFHLGAGADGVAIVRNLKAASPAARILVLSGSFHGRATAVAATAGFEIMQKPARAEAIVGWLERA